MESTRRAIQLLAALLTNAYWKGIYAAQLYTGAAKGVCLPVLNCHACPTATTACPIGTMQHYAAIHRAPLMLLGLFGLVGVLVGRMACGWLCPFGLLQDLLYRIRSAKIRLPSWLFATRYFALTVLVILIPVLTGEHLFSILCPMGTLTAAVPWTLLNPVQPNGLPLVPAGAVGGLMLLKIALLGIFLWLFVVSKRPFCRILCPIGLILSLFNRASLIKLQVSERCTGCGRCAKVCPMDIKVCDDPDSGECIRCLACTSCPQVTVTLRGPNRQPQLETQPGDRHAQP